MMSFRHITSSLTGHCFGRLVGCTRTMTNMSTTSTFGLDTDYRDGLISGQGIDTYRVSGAWIRGNSLWVVPCRCLLSKKARPVMNLINDLLTSILTFSSQVSVGASAGFSPQLYATICTTCKGFRVTVKLLINGECSSSVM